MACQVVDDSININITDMDPGSFVFISDEDIDQMRVKDLHDELKKCGLAERGNTSELISRLKQAMLDR
eukprot:5775157-Ditylum_brightwellii.AAC.1